jgi:4-azaleucine resistance transporter AzlC
MSGERVFEPVRRTYIRPVRLLIRPARRTFACALRAGASFAILVLRMFSRDNITEAFPAALPIILGYVAIGLPCGILNASIGMNWVQVGIMSVVFYSGAGQFMIPNMWLAASPLASIVASVSLVNTRQMLYSASIAKWCAGAKRWRSLLFAATVTDESFGVNMNRFLEGGWSVENATLVNLMSQTSWTLSCIVGALVGNAVSIPLAIASFAMTSIFICLLVTQKISLQNVVAAFAAMVGVFLCKLAGFGGAAILVGALLGVGAGILATRIREAD